MKVDKSNMRHWVYLLRFSFNMVLAGLLSRLPESDDSRPIIVFYGHKLHGNLAALYHYIVERHARTFCPYYLTMDPDYYTSSQLENISKLSGLNMGDVIKAGKAKYIITDHGLHSLLLLKYLSRIKFIDVWHGIPFKGFDQDDFKIQRSYTATFVASPSMKDIYINKYGFDESKVVVSGYARTDRLVLNGYIREEILERLGIPDKKLIAMLAFTWSHDQFGAGDVPFGMDMSHMCQKLQNLADKIDVHFIYRSHLNSMVYEQDYESVTFLPSSRYPDVEELLFVSDVLVSDWSSIVFDYLVLKRPTIFVDRPCPFTKGFTYGPEYRFGAIIRTMEDLIDEIRNVCESPYEYMNRYSTKMDEVQSEVYGGYADGKASHRCLEWLLEHV